MIRVLFHNAATGLNVVLGTYPDWALEVAKTHARQLDPGLLAAGGQFKTFYAQEGGPNCWGLARRWNVWVVDAKGVIRWYGKERQPLECRADPPMGWWTEEWTKETQAGR